MINKLLVGAAAAATLLGGSAMAQQTDRSISGPTIPQRQGIDPRSVEANSPSFWADPSRAANLNSDESVTVTRTYTNPSPSRSSASAEYQAPTPNEADVTFTDEAPADEGIVQNDFDAPAPTAVPADAAAVTFSTEVVASAPVPDTPQNRARYGQPMSNAGKHTAPRGN